MKTKIFTLLFAIVASVAIVNAATYSGSCGTNVSWSLNTSTGVLTINGSGPMNDFTAVTSPGPKYTSDAPWFSYRSSIKTVNIEDGVTKIGSYFCWLCNNLTLINLPNSATSIGQGAFEDCSSLISVTIPNNVTSIGSYAFHNCSSLTSVTISNSVTRIEYGTFYNCSGLMTITLPNSITSIGEFAFSGCSGLTSVEIPNSVTSMENYVFYRCSSLNHVYCELGAPVSITNTVFQESSPTVYVPNCAFQAFSVAPVWKDLTIVPVDVNLAVVNNVGGLVNETCGSMEIEAIPYIGYHFKRWQDGNKDNPRKYTLSQTNRNFIAEFEIDKYQITLSCDASQGSITGDKGKFNFDTEHTIEAVPNYGYHFTQWSDGETDNPREFTLVQDTTFTALFDPNQYQLELIADAEMGAIEGEQGLFDYLSEHEITAVPNTGYLFSGWSDGTTENPRTITLTRDTSITALFEHNLLTVTLLCDENQGSVSKSGDTFYSGSCTITATPNYGYHFTQWTDGDANNPRTFIVTQDTTFTAEFAVDKNGTCGDELALIWTYDDGAKELTISGEGSLNSNCTFGVEAPASVEKIFFEEGITSIGNSAFANYTTLEEIHLASTIKRIYEQAFYNCENLINIYCYREQPSVVYSNTFDGIDKFSCTLHVPSASIEMYKAATGWRDFYYIVALPEDPTSVDNTNADITKSTKLIRDGQIYILRGDKTYTLTGQEMK